MPMEIKEYVGEGNIKMINEANTNTQDQKKKKKKTDAKKKGKK